MNVYTIWLNEVDYDEYRGFTIVAKSEERAIEIMLQKYRGCCCDNIKKNNIEKVERIDLKKEQIVMSDFNQG